MLMTFFSVFAIFPTVASASTLNWSTIFANPDSYFGTAAGIAIADTIVLNQNSDGGWKKDYTTTSGDWVLFNH